VRSVRLTREDAAPLEFLLTPPLSRVRRVMREDSPWCFSRVDRMLAMVSLACLDSAVGSTSPLAGRDLIPLVPPASDQRKHGDKQQDRWREDQKRSMLDEHRENGVVVFQQRPSSLRDSRPLAGPIHHVQVRSDPTYSGDKEEIAKPDDFVTPRVSLAGPLPEFQDRGRYVNARLRSVPS
jgi:hypothetical protein